MTWAACLSVILSHKVIFFDVREVIESPYGTKYILEGGVETPAGRIVQVRTVWIIDAGQDHSRFVTAYPL